MMRDSPAPAREVLIPALAFLTAALVGMAATTLGWTALLVPLLLLGTAVLLVHPIVGMLILAMSVPLESALVFEGATATRLVGIMVVGTWGAQKLTRKGPLTPLVSEGVIQVSILLLVLATASLTWAQFTEGVGRRLFLFLQLILLAILVMDLASNSKRIAWVARALVVAGTVAALLTLEQSLLGGARRAGEGVVGGINRTATTLVVLLPFAFALVRSEESWKWRWLGAAYVALAGAAVAVTLSRMNFLLYPLVVGVHLALMARTRETRRRLVLLGTTLLLVVIVVPTDRVMERSASIVPYLVDTMGPDDPGDTYSGRGFHLLVGLEIFKDNPLLGVGYQNYGQHFLIYQWELSGAGQRWNSPRSPHSSHVGMLANLGVVGFLLWMVILALATRAAWTAMVRARGSPGPRFIHAQALLAAVGLLFLYAFYEEVHQGKLFWIVMGLTLAVSRLSRAEEVDR